ncbi:MAG TPA: DUF72 domain-containing protein [Candidatus Paceibacterota bacterium]|nr:DUF72 domain-containing protein [Verrucomicrobiota bacterium]HSA09172.1 DUF72 domain-containing protein [Candidatus Paceibacterota bacterium]
MSFDRDKMKAAAAALAREGIFIGTSSWKYPGWQGQLYDTDRYIWHGKFSEARFERLCLTEYAEVFKTVCVDAAYYKFPDRAFLAQLVSQVPEDFLFALKVTDQITIKRFANLPRFGRRAGTVNPDFLNAGRFESAFLGPCREFAANVGLLIFEFSRFSPREFECGREFVAALDEFLGRLPPGWRYGVEIRNRTFLRAEYFAVLARYGAAHVFSSWQNMPSLTEQLGLAGSRTNPDFLGARLLLRPGRKYEEAVKQFSPYDCVKEPYPEGRAAGAGLILETRSQRGAARGFIYVNNRFEGNALETIAAMVEQAGAV